MSDRDTTIVVDVHAALPQVLERLRSAAGRPVLLDIPSGSSLLLTAIEFRALGDATSREGVNLTIRTDDPLRLQLASMFGLTTVRPEGGGAAADGTTGAAAAPVSPTEWAGRPARPAANTAGSTDTAEATASRPDVGGWAERIRTKLRSRDGLPSLPTLSRRVILIAGSVLIGLLLVAVAATVLVLPRATVAVTLKRQPVSAELIYAVAPEGAPSRGGSALTIAAQPVSFDVVFDHSIPVTETRVVPDATATGKVSLVNPTTEEVTIDAGTEIEADDGVGYAFVEAVVVPAGAPFENRYGQAEATVRATEAGSAGNLDVGVLTGQLDSGVYFSNRTAPITGGTDRTVPVVADADLEALRAKADEELPHLADETVQSQLPPGDQIIAMSQARGEPTYAFDHEAGDDAETVSIHAVLPITALTFDPAEALAQATAAIAERLAAQAPEGFELDTRSVVITDPTPVAEQPDGAQFRIAADAEVRAVFSEADREAVARELAGKRPDAAEAVLRGDTRFERYRVTYSPGWLPDRMPTSSGRIDVETAG